MLRFAVTALFALVLLLAAAIVFLLLRPLPNSALSADANPPQPTGAPPRPASNTRSAHTQAPPSSPAPAPAVEHFSLPEPPGPGDYYQGIDPDAHPATLRRQLHDLIAEHRSLTYRQLWDALAYTDAHPTKPGHVRLFYTGWAYAADRHGGDQDDWNREHVWAKARGDFGKRPPIGTDLHHIRPTDVTINGHRGNLLFDRGGSPVRDDPGDPPTGCYRDGDSFEPRDAVKGDVARILFYMAVRYEGTRGELDLRLFDETLPQRDNRPLHGRLSALLAWNESDPVDPFERRRNHRIHERQGNRNPFIDYPAWVRRLWPNDG